MSSVIAYALAGTAAGSITGILGAGGGLVLVPLLSLLCKPKDSSLFPTSVAIMLPICIVSLFTIRASIPWEQAPPFLIGSLAGGIASAALSKHIPPAWLHGCFAFLLLWGGIRFLCS